MWIRCNPNPKGKEVPDCVVRAIAIALDMKWYDVYDDLCSIGRDECNMPSADSVWGKYLYLQGFEPFLLPSACPRCITIAEFCRYYPLRQRTSHFQQVLFFFGLRMKNKA